MNELSQLVALLQYAATVAKTLHWRTRSFAQHIALDELASSIHEYNDKIAEAGLGIEPGGLDTLQVASWNFNTHDAIAFIHEFVEALGPLVDAVGDMHDALESTLDDMMQNIMTTKYKLEQLH